MSQSAYIWKRLWPSAATLLPLALWAMLWLSVSPGRTEDILHPGSPAALINGLRTVFPFAAAGLAAMLLVYKLARRYPRGFRFLSPLGLATVYGLVGVVAVLNSPDSTVALRWVALYLSVPLVLWAIVWGAEPQEQLRRIISVTWLVIILGTIALFAMALIYLDLWDLLADPSRLLDCNAAKWFDLTSGRLRDTGVGRYAAIAAIVAISGLWQRRWRPVWFLVLIMAAVLLLFTGARGAFGGFAAGAVLTVLLYSGKRALVAGALAAVVLVPVFWATGVHNTFLDSCVFRTTGAPSAAAQNQTPPSPSLSAAARPTPATADPTAPAPTQPPAETPSAAAQGQTPADQSSAAAARPTPATADSTAPAPTQPPAETPSAASQDQTPADQSLGAAPRPTPAAAAPTTPEPIPQETSAPVLAQTLPGTPGEGVSNLDQTAKGEPPVQEYSPAAPSEENPSRITAEFFKFTGRSAVWADAFRLFKKSPIIGYGFHADRLLLGTHAHNTFVHALVQTGLLGTIPFLGAFLLGWVLLLRTTRELTKLPETHKHLVIQSGAILAFLTMRGFPESTGAFFGVDWLILAPLLLYLHVVNTTYCQSEPALGE